MKRNKNKGSAGPFAVFVSHAAVDQWVAERIASEIRDLGAQTFVDCIDIERGNDIEESIIAAARNCEELVVLITPKALERKYIWMEIGGFWLAEKRIIGVLYGVTSKKLAADENIPVVLKRLHLVDLNDVASYFKELKKRIRKRRG